MSNLWTTAAAARHMLPYDWEEQYKHYGIPTHHESDDPDGHEQIANYLVHAHDKDPMGENSFDVDWHKERVPLNKVEMHPEPVRSRVDSVKRGWASGADVPPPMYVHRAGTYHVVDGHHRSNAARENGETHIDAYVADSPHKTPVPDPESNWY